MASPINSLTSFLSAQGVIPSTDKTAAVAAAPATATAKPAAPAPAKVAAKTAPAAPVAEKTAAQKYLAELGYGDVHPQLAEHIYAGEAAKKAAAEEAEKSAAILELQNRGVVQYHGMMKEACAMKIAFGQATEEEILFTAAATRTPAIDLLMAGQEMAKIAQLAAASPEAVLVRGFLASGARDGEILAQADRNQATTQFDSSASAGTRAPTKGVDGKILGFQEAVTLPGNPGIAAAGITQPVDHGKGLG